MTIIIGLIVGGLWGRSWIDAAIKSLITGAGLGFLVYFLLSPETIALLLKRDANWVVGLGLQLVFVVTGALLGFGFRQAVRKRN